GSVNGDETYEGVTCLVCRSIWSIRRPARYWAPMKRPTDQRRTCRPGSVPADAQRAKERPGRQSGLARVDHDSKSRYHGALAIPILPKSKNQAGGDRVGPRFRGWIRRDLRAAFRSALEDA